MKKIVKSAFAKWMEFNRKAFELHAQNMEVYVKAMQREHGKG